jgi:transcriptional regulator with XRE-family HTH domain
MGAFNGELIRLARQYRGFNQRELARALFVEPSTVSRIENGIVEPSPDFMSRVPEVLKFPPQFFQQNDRVYGLPLSVHPSMWRKKAAVSQHDIDRALAELNIRMMHLRRLFGLSNMNRPYQCQRLISRPIRATSRRLQRQCGGPGWYLLAPYKI